MSTTVLTALGNFLHTIVADVEFVVEGVEHEATDGIQWLAKYGPALAADLTAIESAVANTIIATQPEAAAVIAALPAVATLITKLAGAASTIVTNAAPPVPPAAA